MKKKKKKIYKNTQKVHYEVHKNHIIKSTSDSQNSEIWLLSNFTLNSSFLGTYINKALQQLLDRRGPLRVRRKAPVGCDHASKCGSFARIRTTQTSTDVQLTMGVRTVRRLSATRGTNPFRFMSCSLVVVVHKGKQQCPFARSIACSSFLFILSSPVF